MRRTLITQRAYILHAPLTRLFLFISFYFFLFLFIHCPRPVFCACLFACVLACQVPTRPDIVQDKPGGEASPEYVAFELCGPGEVLVASSVGPWEVRVVACTLVCGSEWDEMR
jgi:hypothetical protein